MPDFANPFSGMVPRKMTKEELIRAIRLDLSAEEEAVHLYMAHADATDDPIAKKVLIDIADEERVHAGEFQRLLNILAPDEVKFLEDGAREVDAMQAELSGAGGQQVHIRAQEQRIAHKEEEEAGEEAADGGMVETGDAGQSAVNENATGQSTSGIKTIGSLFNE